MIKKLPILCPTGVEKTLPANELTLKKDDIFLLSSVGFFVVVSIYIYKPVCICVELQKQKNKKQFTLVS